MKNWSKENKKVIVLLSIMIVLIIIYLNILHAQIEKDRYVSKLEQIVAKNENPTFQISQIYLCSSANAIDGTESQTLENLDLYQYTDIAIYINNNDEEGLTNKNTIKKLYIDNIQIQTSSGEGTQALVYTNLLNIGSRDKLKAMLASSNSLSNMQNNQIDFNIINTNTENNQANYENPTFYGDCSNPITLKYINKLNKTYSVGEGDSTMFDGTILQKAGVSVDELNCKVKFKINIINNEDDYYSAWVNFQIPLSDIYEGTSIKRKTTAGIQYNFIWGTVLL